MDDQTIMTISVTEAARLLGVGKTVCYRLCKDGTIRALRLGRKLRIPRTTIERMLDGEKREAL